MADLLPSIPETSAPEAVEPRVVGLEDEDADEVFAALSSTTARELFAVLNEDPAHPSALADRVDTTLQNVQYHIENMQSAGLVEVVDTAYSEKGREMDVYAPSDRPLVVFAGDDEDQSLLSQALQRLLGGLTIVSAASIAVQGLFGSGEQTIAESTGTAVTGDESGAGDEVTLGVESDRSAGGGTDGGTAADGDGGVVTDSAGADYAMAREDGAVPSEETAVGDGAASGDGVAEQAEPAVETVGTVADDLAWVGDFLGATGLEPGLAALLLGCCLVTAGVAAWYARNRQTRV